MTKNQENLRSMFGAVQGVVGLHASVVSGLPALEDAASRFIDGVVDIDAKASQLATMGVNKTQVKSQARTDLEASMTELGSNLMSFAAKTHRLELFGQAKALLKNLRLTRDTLVSTRASNLAGLLSENLAQLADFGVTAAKLNLLQSRAAAYALSMSSQEGTFAARKSARAELAQMFKDVKRLLKDEMDLLVNGMKSTQPEFYADYWNARGIKDLGIRHRESEPTPEEPV